MYKTRHDHATSPRTKCDRQLQTTRTVSLPTRKPPVLGALNRHKMSAATIRAIHNIWKSVHSSTGMNFPATVAALSKLHVTRYQVDYVGRTTTSYIRDPSSEGSFVDVASIPAYGTAGSHTFNVTALQAALRKVQQGNST